MTLTHLAHLSDRAWAFQEHRVRQTLARPMTRSACVEPLTEAQLAERVWSAAKASHMRAAALRAKGEPGTSALVRKARLETHRQLRLVES
jgi:hypothetical protein